MIVVSYDASLASELSKKKIGMPYCLVERGRGPGFSPVRPYGQPTKQSRNLLPSKSCNGGNERGVW